MTINLKAWGGWSSGTIEQTGSPTADSSVSGCSVAAIAVTPPEGCEDEPYELNVSAFGSTYVGKWRGPGWAQDLTNWTTLSAWIRIDLTFTTTDINFFQHAATTVTAPNQADVQLQCDVSTGDVKLQNANGTTLHTLSAAGGFDVEEYHLYQLKFQKKNGSRLVLFVDGALEFESTGIDCLNTSSTNSQVRFCNTNIGASAGSELYIKNWYVMIDDGTLYTDNWTFLPRYSVLGYTKDDYSSTSGQWVDPTAPPPPPTPVWEYAFDSGNYSAITRFGDNAGAYFTLSNPETNDTGVTFNTGTTAGPKDDSRVAGHPFLGALYLWRSKYTGPNTAVTQTVAYGPKASGSETTVPPPTTAAAANVARNDDNSYVRVFDNGTYMPDEDEYFCMGWRASRAASLGTRDVYLKGMWAALLVEKPTLAYVNGHEIEQYVDLTIT